MTDEQRTERKPDAYVLRKLRFLAKLPDGSLRRLFRFVATGKDTSFYLIPYGPGNSYHVSRHRFGAMEKQKEVSWSGQVDDDELAPKLTLHRSGVVRAHIGDKEMGRLTAMPFAQLQGQHIATAYIHELKGMPEHVGKVHDTGRNRDLVTPVRAGVSSLRAIVRASSREPRFEHEDGYTGGNPWMIPIYRQGERLYVGIFMVDDSERIGRGGGASVIGGWDVRRPRNDEMTFLLLRCC